MRTGRDRRGTRRPHGVSLDRAGLVDLRTLSADTPDALDDEVPGRLDR